MATEDGTGRATRLLEGVVATVSQQFCIPASEVQQGLRWDEPHGFYF